VGKRAVASQLAAKLLAVEKEKLTQNPDFFYLERETDAKTGKLKKNISISQTRDLRARLQNLSWLGGYQVVVINEAELLSAESANALLKLLEEPGEKSVFFLLTDNEQALLSTIRSRCQLFFFNLVANSEIKSGLRQLGHEEELAAEVATLSWGRPGRAITLAGDPDLLAQIKIEKQRWEKMIDVPFYKKLKAIEDLFTEKHDSMKRLYELQKVLDVWMMLWRDLLLERAGQVHNNTPSKYFNNSVSLPQREISNFITSLGETKVLLAQNINPQLLFEQLLLKV
jgi:DNA polymerase-3 subunit delta'